MYLLRYPFQTHGSQKCHKKLFDFFENQKYDYLVYNNLIEQKINKFGSERVKDKSMTNKFCAHFF